MRITKIRKIVLEFINYKKGENGLPICNQYREKIIRPIMPPNLEWENTSLEKKARRELQQLVDTTSIENIERRLKNIDNILGKDW